MELNLKNLNDGQEYIFHHTRKGTFRAKLMRKVKGDDDTNDHTFLECLIDTEAAPRLARTKKAKQTLTNIRPSLLSRIENAPEYIPPASQTVAVAPKKTGFLKSLMKR